REQLLLHDADVPGGERGGGHGEVAVAEVPAIAFERLDAHGRQCVGDVAGDFEFVALRVGVEDSLKVQRVEDIFADELHERLAGDLLDNEAEDDVVGVGVLPVGAGREVERLSGPAGYVGEWVSVFAPGRDDVVLRSEVLVAGGHGHEVAEGDFVGAGEVGEVLGDGVVDGELAALLQQKDGVGGELLGDAADGIRHVRRGGPGRRDVGEAEGVRVDDALIFNDGDGGGGDAGVVQGLGGDVGDLLRGLRGELRRLRG